MNFETGWKAVSFAVIGGIGTIYILRDGALRTPDFSLPGRLWGTRRKIFRLHSIPATQIILSRRQRISFASTHFAPRPTKFINLRGCAHTVFDFCVRSPRVRQKHIFHPSLGQSHTFSTRVSVAKIRIFPEIKEFSERNFSF